MQLLIDLGLPLSVQREECRVGGKIPLAHHPGTPACAERVLLESGFSEMGAASPWPHLDISRVEVVRARHDRIPPTMGYRANVTSTLHLMVSGSTSPGFEAWLFNKNRSPVEN